MKRFLASDAPSSLPLDTGNSVDTTPTVAAFVQRKLHPERQPVTTDELLCLVDKEADRYVYFCILVIRV